MHSFDLGRRPVLIAHEDMVISFGLKAILDRSSLAFDTAVIDPRQFMESDQPGFNGVLVTDVVTGLQVCRTRRREVHDDRTMRVIIIATKSGTYDVRSAIERGVMGYLLSGFPVNAFVDAVEAVSRGTRYLCSVAASKMVESKVREALTLRELEVLRYLVGGHANKEIADELDIAVGTVKAHVKSIFAKFSVGSRTQAACIAAERGIVPTRRLTHAHGRTSLRHEVGGRSLASITG